MIDVHNLKGNAKALTHEYLMNLYNNSNGNEVYVEVCMEDISKYYNKGVLTWTGSIRCSFDEDFNPQSSYDKDVVGYAIEGNRIYKFLVVKHSRTAVYFRGNTHVLPIDVCFLPTKFKHSLENLKDFT